MKLSQRQQKILLLVVQNSSLQSSRVFELVLAGGEDASLVTIKRELAELTAKGFLNVTGIGRSTAYEISIKGRLFVDVNASEYCKIEPDIRYGLSTYNFELFSSITSPLFSESELLIFDAATSEYIRRTTDMSPTLEKKELERLIIELSWKSSRIEGNTYTLLDTEKLILENKEAVGHDKSESRMILNHKDAFSFIRENADEYKRLTKANLEQLHKLLVDGLSVHFGLRKKPVGVIGSQYQPLDNIFQISDGVNNLAQAVDRMDNPYAKALIAVLGISYLQPFEDGNKRTARLIANAILLAYGCAPLSYRSVKENEYREAMLIFYEVNSLIPFKKIFITQYDFAARTYMVRS